MYTHSTKDCFLNAIELNTISVIKYYLGMPLPDDYYQDAMKIAKKNCNARVERLLTPFIPNQKD